MPRKVSSSGPHPTPSSKDIAMQSPRIQRFIDDAECHRDTTAAMKLVPFIEQDPPVPDLQRILSWLYANLRPQKISGLQTVGSPGMALAIDSLRCLVAIKAHVESGLYAHIVRDLEKNWPNIWKCMDVIHARTVEDTHSELSIRLLAGRSNLNVLVLFASHNHLRQIAGTTPGVVAMLMRLSYLEVTTSSHTSNHTYGAVGVLNYYLRIMGHQSPPRWEEEVIAPMGCVKSVARIALAQLSFHISFASRDVFRLAHMTNKINHITHLSNHKPIRNALIAQRSIRILVDALESLLNHPMDDESMEYMSRCISNACNCLRGHIFAIDGITGIIEAFEANVLPVLLGCADMLETDDCAYFSLLCEDLPKYIIYPSVFRAANKSLKKFDSTTVDSYEFQSPRLQRVWAAYSRFKISMDEIEMIKEVGVGHGIEVCANQTCHKADVRSALWLCKNCRAVYYCSVTCQREDWKGQHRSHCKNIVALREERLFEPIPHRDLSFLGSLVHNELMLRSRTILHTCKKHNISMPIIEFNYTEYPFSITICSVTSSLYLQAHTDEGSRNEWDKTIKDGESTAGASIVRLLYPTGQSVGVKVKKVILPDADPERPGDSVDFLEMLGRYYTMRVINEDGSYSPVAGISKAEVDRT